MSDAIQLDVDGPVSTIRMHPPDEHPALPDRESPTAVVGDILGVRHPGFR
jgi:hypothetical protein